MSLFKTLGNKLKRAISIKNLTNAVTGNFTAVGAEVTRVMTTPDPNKPVNPESNVAMSSFSIPQPVQDVLAQKDAQYNANLSASVSANPTVQKVSDFFTKTYLSSMWNKYKNWIIGFLVAVLVFFVGYKVVKKGTSKGARRRR